MPIYEFKCNTCDGIFEELAPRLAEGSNLKCPTCGAVGARRLISAFAAHGLENGHIAVGRKLTGGGGKPEGDKAEGGGEGAKKAEPAVPSAPATSNSPPSVV